MGVDVTNGVAEGVTGSVLVGGGAVAVGGTGVVVGSALAQPTSKARTIIAVVNIW
jgi:hypothetical protein